MAGQDGVRRLFAGWRMGYVQGTSRQRGCLFCQLRRPGDDPGRWILARRPLAFLLLNAFPYNSGHLMVALHRHAGKLADLTAPERRVMWELAALGESLLEEVYHPDGFNLGVNLGRAAGAGVDGHLHIHLVPRWSGDANFMTTAGGTKVLPEDLSETYRRLAEALRGRRRARRGAPRRATRRR